jgi:hypothetical protein
MSGGTGDFLSDRLNRYKHPKSFEIVSAQVRKWIER